MTVTEWVARKHEGTKTIITVSKHKTGDREPATLVFGEDDENQFQR